MTRRGGKTTRSRKSAGDTTRKPPPRRGIRFNFFLMLIAFGLTVAVYTLRLTLYPERNTQTNVTTASHSNSETPKSFSDPDTSAMQPAVIQAIQEAQKAANEAPLSGDACGRLGMVFQAHGLFSDAVSAYEQARQLSPSDFRWPYLQAIVSENIGLPPDAIVALFRSAVQREPNYASLHVRLGQLHLRSERKEEALSAFQAALTLEPDLAIAERELGRALLHAGHLEDAMQHLERALRLSPNDGPTYASLARAFFRLGQRDRAEAASKKSQRFGPTIRLPDRVVAEVNARSQSSENMYMRALAFMNAGRLEQAIELFLEVAKARPRDPYARIHLATCYVQRGQNQRAEERYAAASLRRVELNSVHREAMSLTQAKQALDRAFWGYLRASMLVALQANDREAVDRILLRFEHESEHSSADAHSQLIWGNVLMQKKNVEEAITHYDAGVKLDPMNSNLLFNMGVGLERLNRREEAIQAYRRAVRLDPNNRAGARLLELGVEP